MAVKDFLVSVAKSAMEVSRAQGNVSTWEKQEVDYALQEVAAVAAEVIRTGNRTRFSALLNAFGDHIRDAESQRVQSKLCDLLWHFKHQVLSAVESAPGEARIE